MWDWLRRLKGANLSPKLEGFDLDLPLGTAKCMKCGDVHASRSKHICGGKFNNIEVTEEPKPRSGLLKA